MSRNGSYGLASFVVLVFAMASPALFAQTPATVLELSHSSQDTNPVINNDAPLTITLQDALDRARVNDPQYHAALTDLGVAHEDRVQARAGMLPGVTYNNSYIYTEGTGQPAVCAIGATCPASRFVANNGVHEYISQGNAHESVSLTNFADYHRSSAALAQARAKAEIASRGLVVAVTQAYYGLVTAQRKYATSQRAATEAQRFLKITQELQNGGEVARADVVKALNALGATPADLMSILQAMKAAGALRADLEII